MKGRGECPRRLAEFLRGDAGAGCCDQAGREEDSGGAVCEYERRVVVVFVGDGGIDIEGGGLRRTGVRGVLFFSPGYMARSGSTRRLGLGHALYRNVETRLGN